MQNPDNKKQYILYNVAKDYYIRIVKINISVVSGKLSFPASALSFKSVPTQNAREPEPVMVATLREESLENRSNASAKMK